MITLSSLFRSLWVSYCLTMCECNSCFNCQSFTSIIIALTGVLNRLLIPPIEEGKTPQSAVHWRVGLMEIERSKTTVCKIIGIKFMNWIKIWTSSEWIQSFLTWRFRAIQQIAPPIQPRQETINPRHIIISPALPNATNPLSWNCLTSDRCETDLDDINDKDNKKSPKNTHFRDHQLPGCTR